MVRVDETLADSFDRGDRCYPDRPFIIDRPNALNVSWGRAGQIVAGLVADWDQNQIGSQVLVQGDGSWRTPLVIMAAHLSGRLFVCSDVANPATFSGVQLRRAQLTTICLDEVQQTHKSQIDSIDVVDPYRWSPGEIGMAPLTSRSTGDPKLLGVEADSKRLATSLLFNLGVKGGCYSLLCVRRPSTTAYLANHFRIVDSCGTAYQIELGQHDLRRLDELISGELPSELNLIPNLLSQCASVVSGSWRMHVENTTFLVNV